jgi:translation initiation factor IF-2
MKVKTELAWNKRFLSKDSVDQSLVLPFHQNQAKEFLNYSKQFLLLAELEDFKGKPNIPAEGFIVEANMDDKRGISATMIIKDGTLKQGNFVVVDDAWTTTRIIEDFMGKTLSEISFSTPIRLTGFSKLPNIGSLFTTCESKKEAEEQVLQNARIIAENPTNVRSIPENAEDICIIPIIIKSDVYGTAEAIEGEILKIEIPDVYFKIIKKGVGAISESDIQLAACR